MAINRSAISSESITVNTDAVIEILTTAPSLNTLLSTPEPPGKLIGYYNGITDSVELFVVDNSGIRLLRI